MSSPQQQPAYGPSVYDAQPRPVPRPQPAPRPAHRQEPPQVRFLTVQEVAAIMRVSKMTVYRLVHGEQLASVRVGRSVRVSEPTLNAFLRGGGSPTVGAE